MPNRQVVITAFGPPEVLKLVETPRLPEPGPGEVRVRVLVTSASFTDTMIRKGAYPDVKEAPPFPPGYDLVGVVDKLGPGTGRFRAGARVCDLTVIGAYSDYVCRPEDDLVPVPESVDPGEAVSLVLTYVTAYQMLHRVARVRTGQSILVHGAGGAVGSSLLELAALDRSTVFGTASAGKHAALERFGATLIDYRNQDFVGAIQRAMPAGIDAAFDGLGMQSFKRTLKILKPGGQLVAYGFSDAVKRGKTAVMLDFIRFTLMRIVPGSKKKTFYSITAARKQRPDWFREDLERLLDLLADGAITPIIWRRMPLEDARRAHELIEAAAPQGKIVLEVGL